MNPLSRSAGTASPESDHERLLMKLSEIIHLTSL
jgi:hypothetical protein